MAALVPGFSNLLSARSPDVSVYLAEAAASPRTVLARDRREALLVLLQSGLLTGMIVGLLAGLPAGLRAGPAAGLRFGLAGGLVGGFVFGLTSGPAMSLTAWPSYTLTRMWLALHHQLPWSLMTFLADAHKRGVLRQAGAVYQFRHLDLQRRLAARP